MPLSEAACQTGRQPEQDGHTEFVRTPCLNLLLAKSHSSRAPAVASVARSRKRSRRTARSSPCTTARAKRRRRGRRQDQMQGGDAFAVGADLSKKGAAQALFAAFDQELTQAHRRHEIRHSRQQCRHRAVRRLRRYDRRRPRRDLRRQRQIALLHHAGSGEALEGRRPHHLDFERRARCRCLLSPPIRC